MGPLPRVKLTKFVEKLTFGLEGRLVAGKRLCSEVAFHACCCDKGAKEGLPVPCARFERRVKVPKAWEQLPHLTNPFKNLIVSTGDPQLRSEVTEREWGCKRSHGS